LLSLAVSAFGGAPNENGSDDEGVTLASEAFGAPNVNSEPDISVFSEGLLNENADPAFDAGGTSFAGCTIVSGSVRADGAAGVAVGNAETGLATPKPVNDVLLGSAVFFSSPKLVLACGAAGPKRDFTVEPTASCLAIEELPDNGDVSLAGGGAVLGVVEEGTPKVKLVGKLREVAGLDNAAELAKKFGTAEDPLPVMLASSCSAAGCFGAEASTDGPGLGGISAIWGTAAISGVSGAGAKTASDSASIVIGAADCSGPSLKPFGSILGAGFSAPLSFSTLFNVDEAVKPVEGEVVIDLVREKGSFEIGGSLAFAESC
jgi:hypothetical protein